MKEYGLPEGKEEDADWSAPWKVNLEHLKNIEGLK